MRRPGLRRRYQPNCPYVLYSQGTSACNVNKELYRYGTTVTNIGRGWIDVISLPSTSLPGGFFEWTDPATGELHQRTISGTTGGRLYLTRPVPTPMAIGDYIYVFPGCDHTTSNCQIVFGNIVNYGGFAWMPEDNPFGGKILY